MPQPQLPLLARASAWSPKLLAGTLGIASLLLAAPAHAAGFWMPDTVTIFGDKVNYLYQFMMWFMVAIFVVVEAALVYALWVYRRKPNEERAPEQWTHNTQLELVWTAVPFLILVAIMFPTIDALRYFADVPASASEQANRSTTSMPVDQYKLPEHAAQAAHGELAKPELISTTTPTDELIDPQGQAGAGPSAYAGHEQDVITLEVIGHQFWWEYRYTDPWINAQLNSKTASKEDRLGEPLPIPAKKKIRLVFTAADVIHGWWVPAFGSQQMTTPGNLASMPLELTVDPAEGSTDPKFNYEGACTYLCGPSHGLMTIHVRAVHVNDFLKWASAHQMGESPRRATVIANVGRAAKPPQLNEKPAGGAAAAELDPKVLAEKGKGIYTAKCAGCHQPTGAGIPGVFPPLAKSDWVTGEDAKLVGAITKGVQGAITVGGTAYNGAMPAIGADLSDEELASLVTYLRTSWGNAGKPMQPAAAAAAR